MVNANHTQWPASLPPVRGPTFTFPHVSWVPKDPWLTSGSGVICAWLCFYGLPLEVVVAALRVRVKHMGLMAKAPRWYRQGALWAGQEGSTNLHHLVFQVCELRGKPLSNTFAPIVCATSSPPLCNSQTLVQAIAGVGTYFDLGQM